MFWDRNELGLELDGGGEEEIMKITNKVISF